MTYHRQLAITNYKAIIQATVTSVKKQTAAEQLIAPAAVCYFLFGFLGNHPRSTRLACSFSSRMLHRQPAPSSPKRMDKIPWIKRAASRQSRPAIRNTGPDHQQRCGAHDNAFQVQFHRHHLADIISQKSKRENPRAAISSQPPVSVVKNHITVVAQLPLDIKVPLC